MMLMPDLFSFAYVPNWYSQLDMLEEMALPEPWRFKTPIYLTKNPDTPILERYIHAIFKKQLIDYKEERIPSNAAKFFHIENEYCCFHTGLYTRRYKANCVRTSANGMGRRNFSGWGIRIRRSTIPRSLMRWYSPSIAGLPTNPVRGTGCIPGLGIWPPR